MRVGIYARVSTGDKDQNPETQLMPLREFRKAQEWTVVNEYIDQASATDQLRRTAWRKLLADAAKRKIDVILLWRLDRGFRSVLDAATVLEKLRTWKVGLRSYCEPWLDTTSAFGEALYYVTAAFAQLERGILSERTKAGMNRARKQGKHVGRHPVTVRPGFSDNWAKIHEDVALGRISRTQAAKRLKIGYATLLRLLESSMTKQII